MRERARIEESLRIGLAAGGTAAGVRSTEVDSPRGTGERVELDGRRERVVAEAHRIPAAD